MGAQALSFYSCPALSPIRHVLVAVMGASGSKTRGSKTADEVDGQQRAPEAAAMATGTEEPCLPKPTVSVQIHLEKTSSEENLGISLGWPDKATLLVTAIKETGTVASYNADNLNTPQMQVCDGDRIVDINGVSGDK